MGIAVLEKLDFTVQIHSTIAARIFQADFSANHKDFDEGRIQAAKTVTSSAALEHEPVIWPF